MGCIAEKDALGRFGKMVAHRNNIVAMIRSLFGWQIAANGKQENAFPKKYQEQYRIEMELSSLMTH